MEHKHIIVTSNDGEFIGKSSPHGLSSAMDGSYFWWSSRGFVGFRDPQIPWKSQKSRGFSGVPSVAHLIIHTTWHYELILYIVIRICIVCRMYLCLLICVWWWCMPWTSIVFAMPFDQVDLKAARTHSFFVSLHSCVTDEFSCLSVKSRLRQVGSAIISIFTIIIQFTQIG